MCTEAPFSISGAALAIEAVSGINTQITKGEVFVHKTIKIYKKTRSLCCSFLIKYKLPQIPFVFPTKYIHPAIHPFLLTAFHRLLAISLQKTDALLDFPYDCKAWS